MSSGGDFTVVSWSAILLGLCCFVVPALVGIVALVVGIANRWQQEADRAEGFEERRRPTRAAGQVRRTAAASCPECGTALPADAPEGLCPQCLLKAVVSRAHEAAKSAPAAPTVAYAGPATPTVEELATLFPQLEIIELIGRGGMGAVYKARQPALDRLVALKVLPPEAGRDPAFAERFSREARALARLSHPNIVAVHDVGRAGEFYYLVMEYVDGANLRQVLRDGKLTPEQALRIVPQICDALQYAHEEGIVHRDIKPENILLDRKGRVKIADFGLAKLLGRDTGDFTLTGSRQVMGTLYYMAPEQVERPLEVDHRADIYSLGVVFYEMLTGQLPVGRFPMPSEKAGTDAFLDEVVLRALEREPANRYQHASDVKTDVEGRNRLAPGVPGIERDDLAGRTRTALAGAWRALGSGGSLLLPVCLTGLLVCGFFRWAWVEVEGKLPERPGQAVRGEPGWEWRGGLSASRPFSVSGGETWQGFAGGVLFLSLGVFLVATSGFVPVPVWRPAVLLAAGLAILAQAGSFLSFFESWRRGAWPAVGAVSDEVTVTRVTAHPEAGPFAALALALVLIVVGAIQLRGALQQGQR
jgi:predicted Ser/Thr protein kinase